MAFFMPFMMFGTGSMFFFVKSKRRMVLGAFVRGISFRFGAIGGATFFDLKGFVVGKLGNFDGMRLFGFVFHLVFFNFFDFLDFFLFFKNCVTSDSGDLRDLADVLLLGFDKAGRECGDLVFV